MQCLFHTVPTPKPPSSLSRPGLSGLPSRYKLWPGAWWCGEPGNGVELGLPTESLAWLWVI